MQRFQSTVKNLKTTSCTHFLRPTVCCSTNSRCTLACRPRIFRWFGASSTGLRTGLRRWPVRALRTVERALLATHHRSPLVKAGSCLLQVSVFSVSTRSSRLTPGHHSAPISWPCSARNRPDRRTACRSRPRCLHGTVAVPRSWSGPSTPPEWPWSMARPRKTHPWRQSRRRVLTFWGPRHFPRDTSTVGRVLQGLRRPLRVKRKKAFLEYAYSSLSTANQLRRFEHGAIYQIREPCPRSARCRVFKGCKTGFPPRVSAECSDMHREKKTVIRSKRLLPRRIATVAIFSYVFKLEFVNCSILISQIEKQAL